MHSDTITILIPVYNEDKSLPDLLQAVWKQHEQTPFLEIILIDDGSNDNSWQVINDLSTEYNLIKGIRLLRNFGKSHALDTGLQHAGGDIIITMDADLQDDPSEIPNLLSKLDEGYGMVVGWKQQRHDPLSKVIPSKFFNAATSWLCGLSLHDHNCGLKAFKREVLGNRRLYGELHRYMTVLAADQGFRVTEIPVTHHARRYGTSKFGVERFFRGMMDLFTVLTITRYNRRPGHLFGGIGMLLCLLGGLGLGYLALVWLFTDDPIGGRPLLSFSFTMTIIGIQLICFGMLAEFMLYRSVVDRPRQIVAEIIPNNPSTPNHPS